MNKYEAKKENGKIKIRPTKDGLKSLKEEKLISMEKQTLRELVEAVEKIAQHLGLEVDFSYRTNTKKDKSKN